MDFSEVIVYSLALFFFIFAIAVASLSLILRSREKRRRFGKIPRGGGMDELGFLDLSTSLWLDQMLISCGWFYDFDREDTVREILRLHMIREYRQSPYSNSQAEPVKEDWQCVASVTLGYILSIIDSDLSDNAKIEKINSALPFVGGRGDWVYGWDERPGNAFDLDAWLLQHLPPADCDNVIPFGKHGRKNS